MFLINLQAKVPTRRAKRRREYNFEIDRRGMGASLRKWIDSAHGKDYGRALANAALNRRVS